MESKNERSAEQRWKDIENLFTLKPNFAKEYDVNNMEELG